MRCQIGGKSLIHMLQDPVRSLARMIHETSAASADTRLLGVKRRS